MQHEWCFSEGPDPAICMVCDASCTMHDTRANQPCPGPAKRLRDRLAWLKAHQALTAAEIREVEAKLEALAPHTA